MHRKAGKSAIRAGTLPAAMLAAWLWAPAAQAAAPLSEETLNQALKLNTTQDLYDVCSAQPGQPLYERAVAFCIGYVTGVIQHQAALTSGGNAKRLICPGRELARFEVVKQFLAWAPEHPEFMAEPPVEGLARSAVAAWPCTGQETPPANGGRGKESRR